MSYGLFKLWTFFFWELVHPKSSSWTGYVSISSIERILLTSVLDEWWNTANMTPIKRASLKENETGKYYVDMQHFVFACKFWEISHVNLAVISLMSRWSKIICTKHYPKKINFQDLAPSNHWLLRYTNHLKLLCSHLTAQWQNAKEFSALVLSLIFKRFWSRMKSISAQKTPHMWESYTWVQQKMISSLSYTLIPKDIADVLKNYKIRVHQETRTLFSDTASSELPDFRQFFKLELIAFRQCYVYNAIHLKVFFFGDFFHSFRRKIDGN